MQEGNDSGLIYFNLDYIFGKVYDFFPLDLGFIFLTAR